MSKKIVFLDIDGTLTTFEGVLPDSAKKALEIANSKGHELVICTGRTITQVYPFLLESGLFTGVICGAGSDVRRKGKKEFCHYIDDVQLKHLVSYLEEIHASYFLQCDSGVYGTADVLERSASVIYREQISEEDQEFRFGKTFETKNPYDHHDVNKLIFYLAEAPIEVIREQAGEYFEVMEGSYGLSEWSDGEITVKGYDKAFGMQKYLELCGSTVEDTVAFGDGPNDYEMLDFAHIGVAMGNGRESLKAQADMVTDDILEDGLYHAFEKLGLFEE